MSETERLKELLEQVRRDVENLPDWMKSQEPAPGVSYEDWVRSQIDGTKNPKNMRRQGRIA